MSKKRKKTTVYKETVETKEKHFVDDSSTKQLSTTESTETKEDKPLPLERQKESEDQWILFQSFQPKMRWDALWKAPKEKITWKEWYAQPSVLASEKKEDRWFQAGLLLLSCLMLLPNLGFGLWDCWEPHYAETARMMMVRKDWLHPYWSYAFFLSKPVLMFWYMALSMTMFGVEEWAVRLPFALHGIFLVWMVYFTTSRLFSLRAGLLAGIVTLSAPLSIFLGRQAMVDVIVVAYTTASLGFLAISLFGTNQERELAQKENRKPKIHLPFLTLCYLFAGLTLLAKGLMGVGLITAVVIGYLLLTADLSLLFRIRLLWGLGIAFLLALPWYIHMVGFPGRNIDDGYTFWKRFVINDNFKRVFGGVHGDKGFFAYYIQQLGYALGFWSGFLPVAIYSFAQFKSKLTQLNEQRNRFFLAWWIFSFLLFTLSSTKFHHYVFPLVPISAILIGILIDYFLRNESKTQLSFSLLLAMFASLIVIRDVAANPLHLVNMFVYKYSRPFPTLDQPVVFGLEWFWKTPFFASYFKATPTNMLNLFLAIFSACLVGAWISKSKKQMFVGVFAVVLLSGFYFSHSFMLDLTRHWSQKPLFQALKEDSSYWKNLLKDKGSDARKMKVPDEPLIAFRLRWRGEIYYSLNHDLQLLGTDSYTRTYDAIQRFRKPGRPVYFITEPGRLKRLKRAIGTEESKHIQILQGIDSQRIFTGRLGSFLLKGLDSKFQKGPQGIQLRTVQRKYTHNKYILVKLPPWNSNKPLDPQQTKRDIQTRLYYDDYARNWKKNQNE